jgi:hypothetical protein
LRNSVQPKGKRTAESWHWRLLTDTRWPPKDFPPSGMGFPPRTNLCNMKNPFPHGRGEFDLRPPDRPVPRGDLRCPKRRETRLTNDMADPALPRRCPPTPRLPDSHWGRRTGETISPEMCLNMRPTSPKKRMHNMRRRKTMVHRQSHTSWQSHVSATKFRI